MKELALKKDVDLLLVDSGDLHDGTGLSDGYPAGGVDAQQSNEFFRKLPYDVLTIGSFPFLTFLLGHLQPKTRQPRANTLDMHIILPRTSTAVTTLSSNVNITIDGVSKPVGSRLSKFQDAQRPRSERHLAVLYDITRTNAANTTVQTVRFSRCIIKDEPRQSSSIAGHMPVSRDNCEWPLVFNAIRAVHPLTPILILGGHSHIRDCVQLDGRSMSLESGRYMEDCWVDERGPPGAQGPWASAPQRARTIAPPRTSPSVAVPHWPRQFLIRHDVGRSITKGLEQLAKKFDLSFTYGTAPHDFMIRAAPFPSNNSLLSLMAEVMPIALTVNNTRASVPNIMITNSGSLRFDIYAGPFTKNDQLTASSFADSFLYIPNVPFSVANAVLPALNGAGADNRKRDEGLRRSCGRGGYVTTDACPGVGDDNPARAARVPRYPDFIASAAPAGIADDAPIDLVFADFIETQLIGILNGLQSDNVYTTADGAKYTSVVASEVLGIYAARAWN
ncbi:5'-nucleotidase [Mycena olivaceomarginata]|nr:5'-nucleotidase [Mycena olivaceomarginata]